MIQQKNFEKYAQKERIYKTEPRKRKSKIKQNKTISVSIKLYTNQTKMTLT